MTFTCSMASAPRFVAEIMRRHALLAPSRNFWEIDIGWRCRGSLRIIE